MKKIRDRFENDPYFATYLIIAGAVVATGLIKATAKMVESSAYAYRASKI
jgi:hypothetical protein